MFENSSFGSPELNFSELSYHFKLWFMSTMIIFSLENVILKEKESSCTKSPCISRGLRLLLRPKFEGSYFCRLRDPELLFSAMVHSISHLLGDKMMKQLSQLGFHCKRVTQIWEMSFCILGIGSIATIFPFLEYMRLYISPTLTQQSSFLMHYMVNVMTQKMESGNHMVWIHMDSYASARSTNYHCYYHCCPCWS